MVAVPGVGALTNPPAVTVAPIALHVPPLTASASVLVAPTQIPKAPVIGATAFIVTAFVVSHPAPNE